jgi:pimeloyl-ACP methyl ester carboxylesterase
MTVLLAGTGAAIQAVAEVGLRARAPAPGQLVDIGGGETIHLRIWGVANNKPTVLLFVSAGTPSSAWAWIAQSLAVSYRVVAFDRPGMAWSSGGNLPRDAQNAADALSRALVAADIQPPYFVIAHSYGGFSARVFTAEHRDDVRGLGLLESSHPDGAGSGYGLMFRFEAWRTHLGLTAISPPANEYATLPASESDAAYAVSLLASHRDATADELDTWTPSAEEAKSAGDFGDLPLLVVVTTSTDGHELDLQRDLTKLSTRSQFATVDGYHMGMLLDPSEASAVSADLLPFLSDADPQPAS